MRTVELSNTSRPVPAYSIVGTYNNVDGSERRAIKHVSIIGFDQNCCFGDELFVNHVKPPLGLDAKFCKCEDEHRKAPVHIFARIPDLDILGIEAWIHSIKTLIGRGDRIYVVHPPIKQKFDKTTSKMVHWRFSCVGFVLACCAEGGVDILDWEFDNYPSISRDLLEEIYGSEDADLLFDHKPTMLGCTDDSRESWPVVLPGYIFSALENGLPHRPKSELEAFL